MEGERRRRSRIRVVRVGGGGGGRGALRFWYEGRKGGIVLSAFVFCCVGGLRRVCGGHWAQGMSKAGCVVLCVVVYVVYGI